MTVSVETRGWSVHNESVEGKWGINVLLTDLLSLLGHQIEVETANMCNTYSRVHNKRG